MTKIEKVERIVYCPKCRVRHIDVNFITGEKVTTPHEIHICSLTQNGCGETFTSKQKIIGV